MPLPQPDSAASGRRKLLVLTGVRRNLQAPAADDIDSGQPAPTSLTGWKAIAWHMRVTIRTVQRFERDLGLPIYRGPQGRVFALTSELDRWSRLTRRMDGSQSNLRRWKMYAASVTVLFVLLSGWAMFDLLARH